MALTAYGKNVGLEAATKKMEWAGLFTAKAFKPEATAAGTKIKLSKSEAEGFTNGALVYVAKLEGASGLVEKRTYWVVGAKTSEFELALEEGGAAVSFSTELKTGSEFAVIKEVSGGSYKRVKTTWSAASKGEESASAAVKVAVPATTTIVYAGYWEAETGGKPNSVEALPNPETFTGAGEYEISSSKLEANALP